MANLKMLAMSLLVFCRLNSAAISCAPTGKIIASIYEIAKVLHKHLQEIIARYETSNLPISKQGILKDLDFYMSKFQLSNVDEKDLNELHNKKIDEYIIFSELTDTALKYLKIFYKIRKIENLPVDKEAIENELDYMFELHSLFPEFKDVEEDMKKFIKIQILTNIKIPD